MDDLSSSFADAHILMGGLGNNEVFGKNKNRACTVIFRFKG